MKLAFYKGTRPGLSGLFNILTRWWTGGPYSHVELVLHERDGLAFCASSSFADGGVRVKNIVLDPARWDVVEISPLLGPAPGQAFAWFQEHMGQAYDVLGLAGFLWRRADGSRKRWTCSESCAAALGLADPWRYCPNTLSAIVRFLPRTLPEL